MKEKITATLSFPEPDKYVIKVYRQLDKFHVSTPRTYVARYSEPEKVFRLAEHFYKLMAMVQANLIGERIVAWRNNENLG